MDIWGPHFMCQLTPNYTHQQQNISFSFLGWFGVVHLSKSTNNDSWRVIKLELKEQIHVWMKQGLEFRSKLKVKHHFHLNLNS